MYHLPGAGTDRGGRGGAVALSRRAVSGRAVGRRALLPLCVRYDLPPYRLRHRRRVGVGERAAVRWVVSVVPPLSSRPSCPVLLPRPKSASSVRAVVACFKDRDEFRLAARIAAHLSGNNAAHADPDSLVAIRRAVRDDDVVTFDPAAD